MQKTNYIRALQGELARTISELNGVQNARVMIVVPENKLLASQAHIHPTASVFVDTGGHSLSESAVNAIRSLVANSVEGLKLDDVSVVDNHGKVLSEDLAKSGTLGLSASHVKMRENLENYFCRKVESMLHSVLGEGRVVARVSVDLETTTTTIVEETYDPESQVVRSQSYQENSSSNNESNATQASAEEREVAGGQAIETNSTETRKNRTIAYDINKSTREVIATPGTIKRMTAAVFIALQASSSDPQQYQARSEIELESLKAMIANALGIENLSQVSVQEVAFTATTAQQPFAASKDFSEQIAKWEPVAKNIMPIFGCLILFGIFLYLLKNSKPALDTSFPLMTSQEESQLTALQVPSPAMLNALIQQKPENVSTALKAWIEDENSSNAL
jgi:flagellar M-ring protein FliF